MNGDQHNGDALARPAAATADGEATDGLVSSNDLPSNGVSREMRENADQNSAKFNTSELNQLNQQVKGLKLSDEKRVVVEKKNRLHEAIDVTEFVHVEGRTKRVKDVAGMFKRLNIDYSDPSDWALYIIYQQKHKTLDCALMNKSGQDTVIFLEAKKVDNPFEFLKQALEASGYEEHRWLLGR